MMFGVLLGCFVLGLLRSWRRGRRRPPARSSSAAPSAGLPGYYVSG